ncbi:GRB2-associated-binding protein 1 [Ischnura elegans]|uniref:GRB2-associated-binding protein 1 n=1 Tax=Ischnura elegans TaxID=197161 RepID=UPI001ED880A0|nr:GRB2-associated-binding protein 1 [Ischnura elegans]
MSNNSLEIVHEGWLIKSPPTKPIWRARWRRRWFVLRHSGELPGQYFLEYYTDRNCRKLKGKIDLDQCEQVDAGLKFENRKQKYQHLFDVRTPKRTFYLAAESEKDMNKWVDCVCHVCGLKAYNHEDEYYDYMPHAEEVQGGGQLVDNHHSVVAPGTTEPPTPPRPQGSTYLSGPYIPISECISGRPLNGGSLAHLKLNGGDALSLRGGSTTRHSNHTLHWRNNSSGGAPKERVTVVAPHTLPRPCSSSSRGSQVAPSLDLPGEFYDMPRRLHPPSQDAGDRCGSAPLHSPSATTGPDGGSMSFAEEDEWSGGGGVLANGFSVHSMTTIHGVPSVNWNTYPQDTDSIGGGDFRERTMTDGSVDDMTLKFSRCYAKMKITDDGSERPKAPPRPPKPLHLMEAATKHSYLNLDSISPKNGPEAGESIHSSDSEPSPGISNRPNGPYSNSTGNLNTVAVSDETYDFPRSHQHGESSREPRHCYSNAAPGKFNDVFRYDFHHEDGKDLVEGVAVSEEPTSPRSESSSLASSSVIYSNLPSPLCGPNGQVPFEATESSGGPACSPPAVNRELKPGRKPSTSDSTSHDLSPGIFPVPPVPPTVDRALKPQKKMLEAPQEPVGYVKLSSPPACRTSDTHSLRKHRAAPSPTPSTPLMTPSNLRTIRCQSTNSIPDDDNSYFGRGFAEDEAVYYTRNQKNQFHPAMVSQKRFETIQYLDLDHPESSGLQQTVPKSPDRSQASSIVYKTVDFVKTEAFKRTKQQVEENRKDYPASAAGHDL